MQENSVRDARMTGLPARPVLSWTIAMGLGGLFLGLVGATDSYELPIILRLGLWLGLCAIGGLFGLAIEAALGRFGFQGRSAIAWWLAVTLALAAAMVPVIFLVNSTGSSPQISYLPLFAFNSLAISAALTAMRFVIGTLMSPSRIVDPDAEADLRPDGSPPILGRLPPALQSAQVLALKSEGHYVRVHTSLGEHMILMRLHDAIMETQGINGLQVHRSWWIAREAFSEIDKRSGKWEAIVNAQLRVPISRSFRSAISEAGWC